MASSPLQVAELLTVAACRVPADSVEAGEVALERAGALAISGQVEAAEQIVRERLASSTEPSTRAGLARLQLFCLVSAAQVDAALDQIEASSQCPRTHR